MAESAPQPPPTFSAGWPAPHGPARRPRTRGKTFAVLTLIGAALILFGTFMPWITVTDGYHQEYRTGLEVVPTGPFMLVIGVLLGVLGVTRLTTRVPPLVQCLALIPAAICVFGPRLESISLHAQLAYRGLTEWADAGLGIVALGGVFAFLGALVVSRPATML